MGGMVDFSTGGTKFDAPQRCVMKALEAHVPLDRITFSSDGRGGVRRTLSLIHISLYHIHTRTRRQATSANLPQHIRGA